MLVLRFLLTVFLVCAGCFSARAGSIEDFRTAIGQNDARTVSSLVARGFDANMPYEHGNRGLHFAALENAQAVLQALLQAPGIDLNARNAVDETPLMLAVIRGHQGAVDRLLAAGAAVNKPGWSPLHYAASAGNSGLVALLLGKQAGVDARSPNGTTPLMMAARHGHNDAVKLLISAGADLQAKNEQGMTARDFALRHDRKETAQLLAALAGKAR